MQGCMRLACSGCLIKARWVHIGLAFGTGDPEAIQPGGGKPHLGCVMVEDDSVEIPAVIMLDEVLRGVGCLQASCPHTLMLQQGLVQGKQNLERKGSRIRVVLRDSG